MVHMQCQMTFPNFKKPKRNTMRSSWDRETAQICKKMIKTVRPRTILHWVAPVARRSRQGWDILQCCLCCTSATLPANVWHDTLPHLSGRQWLESGALEEAKLKAKLPWNLSRETMGNCSTHGFPLGYQATKSNERGPDLKFIQAPANTCPCHGHVMAMSCRTVFLSTCVFHVFFMSFMSCMPRLPSDPCVAADWWPKWVEAECHPPAAASALFFTGFQWISHLNFILWSHHAQPLAPNSSTFVRLSRHSFGKSNRNSYI